MSDGTTAPVCIANLTAAGRRQRLVLGVALVAASLAAAVCLLVLDVPRALRLGLFAPLWIGALGLFQARAHT